MLSVYTRHYPPCAQSDPYYTLPLPEMDHGHCRNDRRLRALERAHPRLGEGGKEGATDGRRSGRPVAGTRDRGLTYIDEFNDDELGLLSRSWKVAPITAQKRQERWHSFFSYCVRKRWLKQKPVEELGRTQGAP